MAWRIGWSTSTSPRSVAASDVVQRLLDLIEPVLVERGEWAEVVSTCQRLLHEGNGAQRQRQMFERRGSLIDVADMLVAATSAPIRSRRSGPS